MQEVSEPLGVIECGILSGISNAALWKPLTDMVISGSGPNLFSELNGSMRKIPAFVANQFWQIAVLSLIHCFNPLQVPNARRNWMLKLVED
ncbi:hypothetical protein MRS76_19440 [Rhizobiaceae bacterium n13]|uniref:Uncharacterized protein n=1 Tax=Ferirhizobium litorale TaxID=2927786 RepID=A0AAE3QHS4_9HYPH|nr:hypothetical protein [Fererhizobium litorale]MDI7864123.1 hypothetical protein [Fererhizobium litorale]MDI7923735.1 hypothetical protein [Fererhizobium litorale]